MSGLADRGTTGGLSQPYARSHHSLLLLIHCIELSIGSVVRPENLAALLVQTAYCAIVALFFALWALCITVLQD